MGKAIKKIYNSAEYARKNNIIPSDPSTWDEKYRKRQMELAGILPDVEKEINEIKEGIKKAGIRGKF